MSDSVSKGSKLGETYQGLLVYFFLCLPPSRRIECSFSSGCREDTCRERVLYDLLQGRMVGKFSLLLTLFSKTFSNTFSLKYSSCQDAVIWG